MPFDLPTNIEETCDGLLICFAEWSNTATSGLFWPLILLAFGAILMMASQRFGTTRSFGFASIACLLGAIWLATLGLMTWWIASAFIIVGLIGFASLILNER